MGWEIAQKDGKYRIWSTISDTWLSPWIDREEVIQRYYENALIDFKKKIIEVSLSFPHHWRDHDNHKYVAVIMDKERGDAYSAWLEELLTMRGEDHYRFINETYEKILADFQEE